VSIQNSFVMGCGGVLQLVDDAGQRVAVVAAADDELFDVRTDLIVVNQP